MVRTLALLLVTVIPACAQPEGFDSGVPAELVQFLELRPEQKSAIESANAEHREFISTKQLRLLQVTREINEELDRPALDPDALGVRYAEVEAMCRDIDDRGKRLRRNNVASLTDAQRAKLKMLEDALRLAGLILDARAGRLVENVQFDVFRTVGDLTRFGQPSGPYFSDRVFAFGCQQPRPIGLPPFEPAPLEARP